MTARCLPAGAEKAAKEKVAKPEEAAEAEAAEDAEPPPDPVAEVQWHVGLRFRSVALRARVELPRF